jgi:hypothetical protein
MAMLAAAFPEHHWLEWKFKVSPRYMWKSEYVKEGGEGEGGSGEPCCLLGSFGVRLHSSRVTLTHWHDYTSRTLSRTLFGSPLPHTLMRACRKTVCEYLQWLATMLNFKSMDDWYTLRPVDLRNYGGSSLIRFHDGIPGIMQFAYLSPFLLLCLTSTSLNYMTSLFSFYDTNRYPSHKWEVERFKQVLSFTERMIPFSKDQDVVVDRYF